MDSKELRALDTYFEDIAGGMAFDPAYAERRFGLSSETVDQLVLLGSRRDIALVGGLKWVDQEIEIEGYVLKHKIGGGGMADVYLADRVGVVRHTVAVKLPRAAFSPVLADFDRERQILAALNHEGICHYYDSGITEQGRPFVAMEYVAGLHIDRFVKARRLPFEQAHALCLDMVRIVAFAHGKGVVHCDLKPQNILVKDEDGYRVKIIDFGLGKHLHTEPITRILFGTMGYLAPEALEGRAQIDVRFDVFALGKLLDEILSPLVSKAESLGKMKASFLAAIVARAVARNPNDRYPTAAALTADLERLKSTQPPEAYNESFVHQIWRQGLLHRARAFVFSGAVIAGLVFLVFIQISQQREARLIKSERDAALAAQEVAENHKRFMVALFTEAGPERDIGDLTVADFIKGAHHRLTVHSGLSSDSRQSLLATLSEVNLAVENYDAALEAMDMILNETPSYPVYIKKSRILYHMGRFEAMEHNLDQLVAALPGLSGKPQHPMDVVRLHRALLLHNQGRVRDGIALLEAVEAPRLLFPRIQVVSASFQVIIGNYGKAQNQLTELLEKALATGNEDLIIRCRQDLSMLYLAMGCLDLAELQMESVLQLHDERIAITHSMRAVYLIKWAQIHTIRRDYATAGILLDEAESILYLTPYNAEWYKLLFLGRFGSTFGAGEYKQSEHYLDHLDTIENTQMEQLSTMLFRHWLTIVGGELERVPAGDYGEALDFMVSRGGRSWVQWHEPFYLLLLAAENRPDEMEAAFQSLRTYMEEFQYGDSFLPGLLYLRYSEANTLLGRHIEARSAYLKAEELLPQDWLNEFYLIPRE